MQRRILIIDDHDDLATALEEVFSHVGHEVKVLEKRPNASEVKDIGTFDLVISDLDVSDPVQQADIKTNGNITPRDMSPVKAGEHVKAFKLSAANFRRDNFEEDLLKDLVATVLDYKIRFVDKEEVVQGLRESIEFELPSVISLMHIVLEYLMKRVEKLGVCKPEQSNLFVALDEAFVNAVKHGNKFDVGKMIRVAAEVSPAEARFTIEDQGDGFDVNNIPDPLDPENLFKTSGRGVLFIYNIMDEVKYNDRGNRLTMVKKAPVDKKQEA
ncbi:MAG: ATP-binding protein [Chloracidobacterium sp.]|nr:ATP-binding protein [Chloracidobacterium sp.]